MLKVSGQWVSPGEIEDVVLAVEEVADAAVVNAPDRDGLMRLALFVIAPGTDEGALGRQIQDALLERLAVYKCPRRLYFVDDMPRTSTGKVQRFMLRQMAEDRARETI